MSYDDLHGYGTGTNRRVQPAPSRANIKVSKSTSITFNGRFTLAELREFVQACEGLAPTATVNVNKYAGDQREGSSTTIVVNDA